MIKLGRNSAFVHERLTVVGVVLLGKFLGIGHRAIQYYNLREMKNK